MKPQIQAPWRFRKKFTEIIKSNRDSQTPKHFFHQKKKKIMNNLIFPKETNTKVYTGLLAHWSPCDDVISYS